MTNDSSKPGRQPSQSLLTLGLGVGLALTVLAATLAWSALHLHRSLTAEIASRDGEILDSVAAAQYLNDRQADDTITTIADPAEQIQLALKVSRLHDVIGVRLFSPVGKFITAFPVYITDASLVPADLAVLRGLKPANHFLAHARLAEQELLAETNSPPVPLLLVNIPLRSDAGSQLAGIVQFILNGSSIARQYAALDRQLAVEFTLAFLVAGGILTASLVLAFGRLQRTNRLLAARTADLLRANRELTLAAKTSAVGAVSSYLIHGLKNPLSSLQNFVRNRAMENGPADADAWQTAAVTTQRMQDLIARVVGVLQEQTLASGYEISFSELGTLLAARLEAAARAAGVRWETVVSADGNLSGRTADLVLLILENLGQNAVEATPTGRLVRCSLFLRGAGLVAQIRDEGPGLPPLVRERLFSSCASSKQNGSGIGLAISQQLAGHLGAELVLVASTTSGTCFELILPLEVLSSDAFTTK